MSDVELGFLTWAIIASFIAVFEFFLILKFLNDDSSLEVSYLHQIRRLNEKLTEIEADNLLLGSLIKELKLQANKQPVKVKVRRKEKKK